MTPEEIYLEKLKNRQKQEHADKGKTGLGKKTVLDYTRANGKTVNNWVPRYLPDKNIFDILPFMVSQNWYKNLKMPSGRPNGLDIGDLDYKLQVPVHSRVGAMFDNFICLREAFGGKCAICDDMFEKYKQGDKEAGKKLRPSWRTFYNIYDYDDPDKEVQLFEIAYSMFESATSNDPQRVNLIDKMQLADGGVEIFYDFKNGKTLEVEFKKRLIGKYDFPEVGSISFTSRDPYEKSILQTVYPLDTMLIIPTPEEVKEAYFSYDEEEKTGEEHHEQKQETRTRRIPETNTTQQTKTIQPRRGTQKPEDTKQETRTRGNTTDVKEETKEIDAPPWDEEGEWGQCPAGKAFGKDCNSGPECEGKTDNSCDEKTFAICLKAFEKSKQTEQTPKQEDKQETRTRSNTTEVKEEIKTNDQDTQQRRRRR